MIFSYKRNVLAGWSMWSMPSWTDENAQWPKTVIWLASKDNVKGYNYTPSRNYYFLWNRYLLVKALFYNCVLVLVIYVLEQKLCSKYSTLMDLRLNAAADLVKGSEVFVCFRQENGFKTHVNSILKTKFLHIPNCGISISTMRQVLME
jgi:hypothetical protein